MTDASVTAEKVLKYLEAEAPDVAALLRKDMTAGDVHQTTALGNQGGKKKKKTFAEAMVAGDGKPKPKVEEDDGTGGAVGKSDVEWELPLEIRKIDPVRRQIFGWASISTRDGEIVVDKQGDMILPEDLEKAAYDFVLYSRAQGDMHKHGQTGRVIESVMLTKEKQEALAKSFEGTCDLRCEGWWVGFYVDNDELWAAHKRGERPEFSIGGRGRRVNV
jgi:hypothetical protein